MRIRVSDPEHVESLVAFLTARVHVVAAQVGEREIEASQLGSMNEDARRMELELLLRAWQAKHPEGRASIVG